MKRIHIYVAVGVVCLMVGIRLGVSADAYQDVVCEDTTESDLAFKLVDWSPMHQLERGDIADSISEEYETLGCRVYVLGQVFKFPAKQRWINRHDVSNKAKKITR